MSIHKKLLKIQRELKAPKKHFNKFGNFHYRSLEDIIESAKPLMAEAGVVLLLSDEVCQIENRFYVKATATLVDIESGDSVSSFGLAREAEKKTKMDDAQVTGAASSYARKYALCGLFAIDGQDDTDAQEFPDHRQARSQSSQRPVQPPQAPVQPPQQPPQPPLQRTQQPQQPKQRPPQPPPQQRPPQPPLQAQQQPIQPAPQPTPTQPNSPPQQPAQPSTQQPTSSDEQEGGIPIIVGRQANFLQVGNMGFRTAQFPDNRIGWLMADDPALVEKLANLKAGVAQKVFGQLVPEEAKDNFPRDLIGERVLRITQIE